MNNKLLKATIAGAATLVIAAGTSTFASWSDYDSLTGSQSGADYLQLNLSEPNSQDFDNLKLAPGVNKDYEFVVAGRAGETVPAASLEMTLADLIGVEDGCSNTNSEAAEDNCENTSNQGDFIDEAIISVTTSPVQVKGTAGWNDPCGKDAGTRGSVPGAVRVPLSQIEDVSLDLLRGDTLGPDEKICVGMGIELPSTASNKSQGDSASFNLDFLLEQIV
jgi:hypothetical protein